MAKKKLSITERRKETLLRQVRRMEKGGLVFNFDVRQEIHGLSPQKARFYTADTLYKKAVWVNTETGELIPAQQIREERRKESARKAAETRRRKREEKKRREQEQSRGEMPDISEDILSRMDALIRFFDRSVPDSGTTLAGKKAPKPDATGNYAASVKNYIREIFYEERSKNPVELAARLYDHAEEIDDLIGVIEYSMYMEAVRVSGNALIAIIRGTEHLSMEDRQRSEELANTVWDDEE